MKTYFSIDIDPYSTTPHYKIFMTQDFYDTVGYLNTSADMGYVSYNNIYYYLVDLKPSDFYKYISTQFNAKICKTLTSKNHLTFYFLSEQDAQNFTAEMNKRFQFCIDNKYFTQINYE